MASSRITTSRRATRTMQHVTHDAFGPLWAADSRVLILGSIPSPQSRKYGFYYMHPQNRFWRVMAALFGEPVPEGVANRRDFAIRHHIALYDALVECDIAGASDASIRNPVAADLRPILHEACIQAIFCTGAASATYFTKYCKPALDADGLSIPMTRLPSTSPANASWSLDRLVKAYRPVLDAALDI